MSNDPAGIGRHQGLSSASSVSRFPAGEVAEHVVRRALRRTFGVLHRAVEHTTGHLAALNRRSTSRTQNRSWPQVVALAACSNRPTATARSFTKAGISSITFWRAWSCSHLPPQLQLERAPHRLGADALGVGHHPQQQRRVALLRDALHQGVGAARPQATAGQGQDLGPTLRAGLALGEHAGQLARGLATPAATAPMSRSNAVAAKNSRKVRWGKL
jgi:hypothetical protein